MVRLITGNEPYLIDRELKSIKASVSMPLNLRVVKELTADDLSFCRVFPFVDPKRVLIWEVGTLKSHDGLLSYLESPCGYADIVVVAADVDKRGKLYKALSSKDCISTFNKVETKILTATVLRGFKELNVQVTESQVNRILSSLDYYGNEDCSLYTVMIAVRQIAFASGGYLTDSVLDELLADNTTSSIWSLIEKLSVCDRKEVFLIANKLLDSKEDVIGMLSAILRNFRIAYKASLYRGKSNKELSSLLGVHDLYRNPYLRTSTQKLDRVVDILIDSINSIKSGYVPGVVFISCITKVLDCLEEKSL